MGEEDAMSEKQEPMENEKVEVDGKGVGEGKTEAIKDKIGEQHDGVSRVTEIQEDKQDEEKSEALQMDVDKEENNVEKAAGAKVAKGKKEEGTTVADEEMLEAVQEVGGKKEGKNEKMEEEAEVETTKGTEEKAGDDSVVKEVENKSEELKEQKSSKKRPRSKTSAGRKDKTKEKKPSEEEKEQKPPTQTKDKEPKTLVQKKENELKTLSAFSTDRPVRERKSVERLVAATIKKDSGKEFHIEKGRGTALKDIPNVAYNLSRKKSEDVIKPLHGILIGRRAKAGQMKINISRFSGFVWYDNEEKQMDRVQEKLDKLNKEKLIEFCDVLDVPISKHNERKDDIITKLMEFLMEPHATTSDLLAEKEQGVKRKRPSKSASGTSAPSKGSSKSRKKAVSNDSKKGREAKSTPSESSDGSDNISEEAKEGDMNGAQESEELSEQVASERKGSESEEESDEDNRRKKPGSTKSSKKKGSFEEVKTKEGSESEKESDEDKGQKKPRTAKSSTKKSSSVIAKTKEVSESEKESDDDKGREKQGLVKSSIKKGSIEKAKTKKVTISRKISSPPKSLPVKLPGPSKTNNGPIANKSSVMKKDESVMKSPAPKKSLSNEGPRKKVRKVKQKPKEETIEPSDDEVRNLTCKILKEADFNKVTFTDILKMLGKEFNTDLTPRRAAIKVMVAEELQRESEEAEEKARESAEKDEKTPSNSQRKAESDSKEGGEAKSTPSESEDGPDNISEKDKEEDMNGAQERSEELFEQVATEGKRSDSEEESDEDRGQKKPRTTKSSTKDSPVKVKTKEVSESEEKSDEYRGREKQGLLESSIKKCSAEEAKTKKVTISRKISPPPKRLPAKSPDHSKSNNGSSTNESSVEKKDEAMKKSLSIKGPGKRVRKVKQKPNEETVWPSDDEVRNLTCKIVREADFSKVSLTDILKMLGKEFNTDLTPRRAAIKAMVAEELRREADEAKGKHGGR